MQQTPQWEIDFSNEARDYFLDNDPYTFELLAELFRLTYYTDPLEGCTALAGNPVVYILAVMGHRVMFTFESGIIYILAVKPD